VFQDEENIPYLPNNIIILNAFIAGNQLGSSLHDRLGCAKISNAVSLLFFDILNISPSKIRDPAFVSEKSRDHSKPGHWWVLETVYFITTQ